MSKPKRISPDETRREMKSGDLTLVCAYDDDEKFERNALDGAIALSEFRTRLPTLSKSEKIAFY
jgi:hypothetical protein